MSAGTDGAPAPNCRKGKGDDMTSVAPADRGVVDSIWRYPVKSMAGEELAISAVTERGLHGDRAYALVDKASNRAATVRTWAAALLNYRAVCRSRNREHCPTGPNHLAGRRNGHQRSTDADGRLAAFGRSSR
jgi:hypothetical protein